MQNKSSRFWQCCVVLLVLGVSAWTAEDLATWSHQTSVSLNTATSGANISSNVTQFPVLVRLNSTNFPFTQALSNGEDLRFSKSNGTRLSYEIEKWDAAKAEASIWVKVDTVFANNNSQSIKMYWGKNGVASQSNSSAVFDTGNGFADVWHFSDTTDATSKARNVSREGAVLPELATTGAIGGAINFSGTNDTSIAFQTINGNVAHPTISLTNYASPNPYTVTKSGEVENPAKAWMAFDGVPSTSWDVWVWNRIGDEWITIDLGSGGAGNLISYIVQKTHSDYVHNLNGWTIAGSNDGIYYVDLDRVFDQPDPLPQTTYSVNAITSYRYYKFYKLCTTDGADVCNYVHGFNELKLNIAGIQTVPVVHRGSYVTVSDYTMPHPASMVSIQPTAPLTDYTTPLPYEVSSSYQAQGPVQAWRAFDGNPSTSWDDYVWGTVSNEWILINLGPAGAGKLVSYTVQKLHASAVKNVNGWTIAGSNDGISFTDLNTKSDQPDPLPQTTYSVNASTAYQYYKFYKLHTTDGDNFTDYVRCFSEIKLTIDLNSPGSVFTMSAWVKETAPTSLNVPTAPMKSATAPAPYTITCNQDNNAGPAWRVFDGDNNTSWVSLYDNHASNWLQIDLGAGNEGQLVSYTVQKAFGGYPGNPNSNVNGWTLKGSLDGVTWTSLDQQGNFGNEIPRTTFSVVGIHPFRYYRFSNFTFLSCSGNGCNSNWTSYFNEISLNLSDGPSTVLSKNGIVNPGWEVNLLGTNQAKVSVGPTSTILPSVLFAGDSWSSWHQLVWVFNNNIASSYFDGVPYSTQNISPIIDMVSNLTIGRSATGNYGGFNGLIDEVRIEKAIRSPDWIKLCYMNQVADQRFVSIGKYPALQLGADVAKDEVFYADEAVFEHKDGSPLVLAYTNIGADGRIPYTDDGQTAGQSLFYIKDHLGSTRVVVGDDGSVQEATGYTAYGEMFPVYGGGMGETREKFTGKEFDEDGGQNGANRINLIYFGSRYYDAELGVWGSPDPKSESFNTYEYCSNNSISYVDPNGESFVAALIMLGVEFGMSYLANSIGNRDWNPESNGCLESTEISIGYTFGGTQHDPNGVYVGGHDYRVYPTWQDRADNGSVTITVRSQSIGNFDLGMLQQNESDIIGGGESNLLGNSSDELNLGSDPVDKYSNRYLNLNPRYLWDCLPYAVYTGSKGRISGELLRGVHFYEIYEDGNVIDRAFPGGAQYYRDDLKAYYLAIFHGIERLANGTYRLSGHAVLVHQNRYWERHADEVEPGNNYERFLNDMMYTRGYNPPLYWKF